jgi:ribonuclease HI
VRSQDKRIQDAANLEEKIKRLQSYLDTLRSSIARHQALDDLKQQNSTAKKSTYVIEFDGGTSCNNPKKGYGEGYGSYQVSRDGIKYPIVRLTYGMGFSSNAAEIRTAGEAIEGAHQLGLSGGGDVLIRGDSKLALRWIKSCLEEIPRDSCSESMCQAIKFLKTKVGYFPKIRTEWRPRKVSLEIFGH